ncbi:HAD-IC family P-type ATPase [Caballeronia sordidicola]|uniref:Cation transport ATPase n=1 Tax=Caballeronia sordidicola TaxID=196367 RepID=A0A242N9F5_CABSO|nr:HAD-IC family P-type ATPase [Caballeronia sordidicola]OTP80305.1 Cation transport ATPase [Caballeronia sordidicola]
MTVSSPGPGDDTIALSVPQAGAPKLTTTDAAGLSTAEAALRLKQNGANAVADITPHPLWRAVRKLWAPVPWMLEAAIVLQLGLGDYVGAGIVLLLLLFNAGLGLFQEGQAQATVDALKSRLALIAAVRRDGQWTTVPAAALVAGDIVKLSLGTVVAADVRLSAGSVLLDQSMLTGESAATESGAGSLAFAGALVRRGEAVAEVIATGERTKFGRTAELVRTAKVESSQQKTVLRVVRNLVLFNGAVTLFLGIYAFSVAMPIGEVVPLLLVALLSSIPVALPSMFTLAAAVGARSLASRGVLPTSLSAVDEAAGIDILCSDKTGTLTRNELAVMAVRALPPYDEAHVLVLAAAASSDGGQDPVDTAIRRASASQPVKDIPALITFIPFDPALKRSEATVCRADGAQQRVLKGAFSTIAALAQPNADAAPIVDEFEAKGLRVLAVAAGTSGALTIVGFIALSDPPRDDSAALVTELDGLGVRTVMVTGDARKTAETVATSVGIKGAVWDKSPIPADMNAESYAVFAGVLPEDKYQLVKSLQQRGHIVGMCGDGANDAPALRQAQMGIAVSTATDVAKSAAGVVLTEAGLGGIVALVKEGRTTFQRILTYTLRSIIHKIVQVLFLAVGLILTGHAILTPALMVLMMVTGDFLAMSSSTDNVRPSPRPNIWRIRNLTIAGIVLGIVDLLFCVACLATAKFALGFDTGMLRTVAVVTLVFSGQAVFYVAREREHLWSSVPGKWLILSSMVDLTFISILAINGVLMDAVPFVVIFGLLGAAAVLALVLDSVKQVLFHRLTVA